MMHVDQSMGHERVVVVSSGGGGRNRAILREQKTVSRMKDLVANSSVGGPLVKDLCAGSFSVAEACMMVLKDRGIVC